MRKISNIKGFLLVVIFIFIAQTLSAHPFGLSISNLVYSKNELTYSTRILYDDFRIEFQKTAHVKGKNYVKQGFDNEDKKDLQNYFRNNVHIFVDNKELKLKSIKFSFELHENDVFIFIAEVSYKAKIVDKSKIQIQDNILFNTVKGQRNLINVFLKKPDIPSHAIITLDKQNPAYEFTND